MGYVEDIKSIMQWGNSFERMSNFPLDRTDLHISYEDAVLYAKGDASDSRRLGKLAYIGQTITVWGLNEKGKEGVWVYSLVPPKEGSDYLADLKPVGSATTVTAEKYRDAKTLSTSLDVGQLILVSGEDEIEGQTYKAGFYIVNDPDKGIISALDTSTGSSDEIGALSNRVSALESNTVSNEDFTAYQGTVEDALDAKVDDEEFTTYKGTVESALAGKVDNSYKQEVEGLLAEKATVDSLNALEKKVDEDIQDLSDHMGEYDTHLQDYGVKVAEVEGRLTVLEAFEETHAPILKDEIIGLFTPNTEA